MRPGGRAASGKALPAFDHDPLVRFGDVHTVTSVLVRVCAFRVGRKGARVLWARLRGLCAPNLLWLPRKPQWSGVWSQPMPVGAMQRPYSIVCICGSGVGDLKKKGGGGRGKKRRAVEMQAARAGGFLIARGGEKRGRW